MNRGGRTLVALAAAAIGAVATGQAKAEQTGEAVEMRQAMTYEIGVTTAGVFTPIATLSFDGANNGTLVLGGPHPRTSHLVRIWSDVSGRDKVRIPKTDEVLSEDGTWTNVLMSVEVNRSDPEFPEAMLRFLAHEYGFDSRP